VPFTKEMVVRGKRSPRERLAFIFSDVTEDTVSLDFEWEKVRVSIRINAKGG
jgi:hypothetical protein